MSFSLPSSSAQSSSSSSTSSGSGVDIAEIIRGELRQAVLQLQRENKRASSEPDEEPEPKMARFQATLEESEDEEVTPESFPASPDAGSANWSHCLVEIAATEVQRAALYEDGVESIDLLLSCTEPELTSRFNFSFNQLLRTRRIRARESAVWDTTLLPNTPPLARTQQTQSRSYGEVTRNLPAFRGTTATAFTDADTFVIRFETVLKTFDVPPSKWAAFMTMQLHDIHDSQYWDRLLASLSSQEKDWTWYKNEFLRHFRHPRLTEAKRDELMTFTQKSGERIQQYSDRFVQTLQLANLGSAESSLAVNYYRNGIRQHRFREALAAREPVDSPYDLTKIITTALFIESSMDAEQMRTREGFKPTDPKKGGFSKVGEQKHCGRCRSPFHTTDRCKKTVEEKKPAPKPTLDAQTCKICQQLTSHRFWECPKAVCTICKKVGHIATNCPEATCDKCRKKGHTAKRCPRNKGDPHYLPARLEESGPLTQSDSPFVRGSQMNHQTPSNQTLIPVRLDNRPTMALIDPGSTHSFVARHVVVEMGHTATAVDTMAHSAFSALPAVNVELTNSLRLECGRKTIDHRFFIADLWHDLIIGHDLLAQCGIGLTGLPVSHPADRRLEEDGQAPASLPIRESLLLKEEMLLDQDRIAPAELETFMSGIQELLIENSALNQTSFCTYPDAQVRLDTGDALPVYTAQYAIPHATAPAVDDQVKAWIEAKRVVPANPLTRWNSPLLTAPKKDLMGQKTELRICLDLRRINTLIRADSYGIPRIKDLFEKVHGFVYCSGLDLASAYTQFPILAEDCEKTTFTWRGSKYMFVGAPFGFTHLPSHFQRVFSAMLYDCRDYVIVYLDDVFIFSKTLEKHIKHVRNVLAVLNKWHLILKIPKCGFGFHRLRLLGHILSGRSVEIDPQKVTTFSQLPKPTTGKQVASFLGFASFLRDYIPKYSTIAAPLERLKQIKVLKDEWTQECEEAMATMKWVLARAPTISIYDDRYRLLVATDASLFGVGAVLYQEYDEKCHYISFFSKALNPAQRNYPATKRELLAIVYALKAFRQWIHGNEFTLFTDHKALTYLFTKKEPTYMLQNWADELLNFKMEIIHRPGIEMVLPDSLSRLYFRLKERTGLHLLPDNIRLQATYTRCASCRARASQTCGTSSCIDHCTGCPIHPTTNTAQQSDGSTALVPVEHTEASQQKRIHIATFIKEVAGKKDPGSETERKALIEREHLQCHQGAKNIQTRLWLDGWFWPNMISDIRLTCDACQTCLRFNLVRNGFHPLKTINATYPMDHICLDLFTLNHTSISGKNYVLVITDVATRFSFLYALENKSAICTAKGFFIFLTTLGVPKIVQTDNGTEFVNILGALKNELGFDRRLITPYYPQSNGAAEAHVKLAKSLLIKMCNGNIDEWDTFVPIVQMAINSRVSKRTRSTPFSLMFGRPFSSLQSYEMTRSELLTGEQLQERHRVLQQLVYPIMREVSDATNTVVAAAFDASHSVCSEGLPVGSLVMKLDKLRTRKTQPAYAGPYKIIQKTPNNTYVLEDSAGALLPRNATMSELKIISPSVSSEFGEKEFEVESILNHRGRANDREFFVKWQGFDSSQNTWEPLANLHNASRAVEEYYRRRGTTRKR